MNDGFFFYLFLAFIVIPILAISSFVMAFRASAGLSQARLSIAELASQVAILKTELRRSHKPGVPMPARPTASGTVSVAEAQQMARDVGLTEAPAAVPTASPMPPPLPPVTFWRPATSPPTLTPAFIHSPVSVPSPRQPAPMQQPATTASPGTTAPIPEQPAQAEPQRHATEDATAAARPTAPARPTPPNPPNPPAPPPEWLLTLKSWLFGGNLVAKLGLLILFIGVSFLLKYTAARVSVPIELRLAGVVLADLALLAWSWRIRERRPAISLPVQGTAMAVLMLVVFGAFRLYHLMPGSLAFALLFVLTGLTCALAVLQNAQWLAIFGIAGGFATPILASTGGGSHISLFSYYALLNAGVFGIALLRSWRPLNLLGFVFTFAIGTTWGVLAYTPANYLSCQLFLILFFLFYVGISLSYARQQAVKLKHVVDGTLIFGTPLLGFGLQYALVHEQAFGLAFSALVLGLFYIMLASLLGRRREQYGLLVDAFLVLGVVFGTLAVPFALDGRWTSSVWALEGAGIVWIGLRQRQPLTWGFGLLLQLGAWLSFVGAVSGLDALAAREANLWLGFILLAASAFMMATVFRAQDAGSKRFSLLSGLFLTGAACWLISGAWTEIILRTSAATEANLLAVSALLAATGLGVVARRMQWPLAKNLSLLAQGVAGAALLLLTSLKWGGLHPLINLLDYPILGALMVLAGALFSSRQLRAAQTPQADALSKSLLAWAGMWWFIMILPALASWIATHYHHVAWPGDDWTVESDEWCGAYGLLLAAGTPMLLWLTGKLQWPALRWTLVPTWAGLAAGMVLMLQRLYLETGLPSASVWIGWGALWLAGEGLLRAWPARGWRLAPRALMLLHTVRTAGPWLMIWPVAATWIARGLQVGDNAEAQLLLDAGWHASSSWARFIPAWLMMAAIAWLIARCRTGQWPVAPIADWYRRTLIPLACGWSLLLLFVWNLTQDGAMAPLPYVPLVNPLDLSSCFALLLALSCQRMQGGQLHWRWKLGGALLAYAWLNLALLRAVSHYMDIAYDFPSLFASQFVQALLSLLWSGTALLLMRRGSSRLERACWLGGAAVLGLVVAKLFLVDLSNVGGVERIISFVGVGAVMVGIGYLAPFPSAAPTPSAAPA